MDQLTRQQRREAAERLTAILDLISAGTIDAMPVEAAYLDGTVHGLRGDLKVRGAPDCT